MRGLITNSACHCPEAIRKLAILKIGELIKGAKEICTDTGTTIGPKFANYHTFTDEEFRSSMEGTLEEMCIH